MGTELIRHHVKDESMDMPSIPPGFESLAAFSLKRVEDSKVESSCSVSTSPSAPSPSAPSPSAPSPSAPQSAKKESGTEQSDSENIKRSNRRKLNYGRIDTSSGDESGSENQTSSAPISKGVIRGCQECSNCQKVIARWRPEESRKPDLLDAPVFYPTEEEFEDTLKYISSIREKAEAYGICRIVPPSSWKPPCPLKEKTVWEGSAFATRIQRVDKLQNRDTLSQMLRPDSHKKRKKRRVVKAGSDIAAPVDVVVPEACFGFEPGPRFTLKEFQKYADDFKTQYFGRTETNANSCENSVKQDQWEPSLENIEGEYWRMVERPSEEIEVLYGADLETGTFGSGFPKEARQVTDSDEKYIKSGWNLNTFPRLPGSLLSYESSDISGVLVPWLYVGMCFSSFCWHVEDHHLYSMNYMHFGAPKMWYGVPGKEANKLEAAMRKHLPNLFAEQPDLLHKLVTQLSPNILKSEGVPVFRCIQNPGEFILTFPRAYHSGFNCGFNCAEAVNVAPVDWLPHGHNALELYREQARRTSISHDKLLLGAARDAVKAQWELNLLRKNTPNNLRWKEVCGKDGILSRTLKSRVEIERVRREFLCSTSKALKMDASFDSTSERECSVCYFDLHLSAAGCHHCSPLKYSCLNHAKQFCSCAWGAKFFLLRYDIKDLTILVEALEGKLSAIYRWAKLDLGLALAPYVSKDKQQSSTVTASPSKEVSSITSVASQKDQTETSTLAEASESSYKCKNEIVRSDKVILLSDDEGEDRGRKDFHESHSMYPVKNPQDLSIIKGESAGGVLQQIPETEEKDVIIGLYAHTNPLSKIQPAKPKGQKGPRMAKMVRRINFQVELLDYGVVQLEKLWCDSRAIYPKGFRSRVKYINVLDPADMCYYISEILDVGKKRPLFMVSLEDHPSEVFIHYSAARCWEMVRERVNVEISKKHRMKVLNLHPLQPPGSLDGFEMFGFTSPSILQGLQSLDRNHQCADYWESRPFHSHAHDQGLPTHTDATKTEGLATDTDTVISGLLKKANLEELNAFLRVLSNDGSTSNQLEVTRLINEEILKRPR